MKENIVMLKIENVSKVYKLGEIGGTTLRDEIQRIVAKIRHKPDPTKKVGDKDYNKGEKFKALDNISFQVNKGERVGIIGHNGAGKSTLLKLVSRVTGPTSGNIYLNGRVASMLEVGTGFHPELTGRENVYMNGAILGMTKKEIDKKIESIIDFSEVRQFIDTPVKRYSSGMYVKLAFSVAAHLDSEIMIMDEVLAVGDVSFQNKCLNKMKEVSEQFDKTILYVSHNMSTIRQLCNRVIVLDHGVIVYDGGVEDGIKKYLNSETDKGYSNIFDLTDIKRPDNSMNKVIIKSVQFENGEQGIFDRGCIIKMKVIWKSHFDLEKIRMRMIIRNEQDIPVGTTLSKPFVSAKTNLEYNSFVCFDSSFLAPGKYFISLSLVQKDENDNLVLLDHVTRAFCFGINKSDSFDDSTNGWEDKWWGNICYPQIEVK